MKVVVKDYKRRKKGGQRRVVSVKGYVRKQGTKKYIDLDSKD